MEKAGGNCTKLGLALSEKTTSQKICSVSFWSYFLHEHRLNKGLSVYQIPNNSDPSDYRAFFNNTIHYKAGLISHFIRLASKTSKIDRVRLCSPNNSSLFRYWTGMVGAGRFPPEKRSHPLSILCPNLTWPNPTLWPEISSRWGEGGLLLSLYPWIKCCLGPCSCGSPFTHR